MSPSGHVFPPIRSREDLPDDVLVVVAHPDDEVIGIGGLLAFHGRRGDRVSIVHATDGASGDPGARHADIAALRQGEVRAALATLEIGAPDCLGFGDGQLERDEARLTAAVGAHFAGRAPRLVYSFHGGEFHADHRALARACCAASGHLPEGCRVLLFGVNQVVAFGALYDYSDLVTKKRQALACFRSQLAYLDFATKVMHRDQAATVNVELPEVTHAELLVEVRAQSWPDHLRRVEDLRSTVLPIS